MDPAHAKPDYPEPQWKPPPPPWWAKPAIGLFVAWFVWVVVVPSVGLGALTPDLPTLVSAETRAEVGPAQVVVRDVEPINLDCVAYVTAAVELHAEKSHGVKILGKRFDYRTDTADLRGSTDVDVCVSTLNTVVEPTIDGTRVSIGSGDIVIRRPRVDHRDFVTHTADGWVGDVSQVVPGVSDNSSLKDYALGQAQYALSSGECVNEAWEQVSQAIRFAYAVEYGDLNVEVVLPVSPNIDAFLTEQRPALPDDVVVSTDVTCLVLEGPPSIPEGEA